MGLLNFDARTVAPQVGIEPVPDGWYKVVIMKSNIVPTAKGDGGMLKLDLPIIEGQFQNRNLFWYLNLFNPSQQASEIAYKQLSAICHVVGQQQVQDQNVPDTAVPMLHNIPFLVHVVIVKGDKGPMNNIVGVKDVMGNEPGKQGGGGPMVAQPQQPTGFQQPPQNFQQPNPGPNNFQAPQNFQAPGGGPAPGGTAPGGWQAPQNPPQNPPQQPGGWGPPGGGAAPAPQQPQAWQAPGGGQQPTQPAQNQQPQTWQAPGGQPGGATQQPPPNAPWTRGG